MNIIVKPYDSDLCHCRPDTTWERENKDFYSPECVNEVLWAPVIFARVAKAGKCIGNRFVERYYDGIGCGMLMYCMTEKSAIPSSCVDHTSILPMPLYDPEVMEGDNEFVITRASTITSGEVQAQITSTARSKWRFLLEEAICNASQLTSLRIGDFVAVELAPLEILAGRDEAKVTVKGNFCGNDIFDFNVIF